MTIEQQVLAAKTPRDALLVLARAVDALQTPADPWASWGDDSVQPLDDSHRPAWSADDDAAALPQPTPVIPELGPGVRAAAITDEDVKNWIGRNYGQVPADDAEGRAIVAQVRADLEKAGTPEAGVDLFRTGDDGVIESAIDWAPQDEQHRALRYAFAKNVLQIDVLLGPHPTGGDWAADYASGGPMWLYIPNRDLVLPYPDNVKAAMVEDVGRYDQKAAYELAQDILKQPMIKDAESPANRISMGGEA
jgi:hypothetical protein